MSRRQRADPAPEPQATHVEISFGERHVVVNAAEPLDVVAAKALAVWSEISSTPAEPAAVEPPAIGFGTGQFAAGELAEGGWLMPPEIAMPDRLQIPEQETPDDRRDN